jgi:malonyl CoA-acyl carrier protein transacylase/uridine kinase
MASPPSKSDLSPLPRNDALLDPGLVVIVPASGTFPSALPRQLYDTCPAARQVFDEALVQLDSLPESDFFALFEGSESGEPPTALDKHQRCARLIFLIALYRHFESVHGVRLQPAAVLGNSLGFLTGLAISGALGVGEAVRLWSFLYDCSEAKYARRRYCSMKVRGIQPEEIRRYTKVGRPELFYVRPGPISFLSGDFDRLVKTMVKLERHPTAQAEICGGPQRAPFHLRSFRTERKEIERFFSTLALGPADIPIYSPVPGEGRIDEVPALRRAMLHTLFEPYRWDRMLEQLVQDRVQRVLCLGFDGRRKLRGVPVEILELTSLRAVREAKATLLRSLGRSKTMKHRQELLEALRTEVELGAGIIALDGLSGAGKTTLSAEFERHLRAHGRDVRVISLGAFGKRAALEAFMKLRPSEHLDEQRARRFLAELLDQAALRRFLEEVRAIRTGQRPPSRLDLGDQQESIEGPGCGRWVHVAQDTIVLLEGNGAVNEQSADLIDLSLFMDLDTSDDCDVERMLRRKQDKVARAGHPSPEGDPVSLRRGYLDSARRLRRPLMRAHLEATRHLYHCIIDNTVLEGPTLTRGGAL